MLYLGTFQDELAVGLSKYIYDSGGSLHVEIISQTENLAVVCAFSEDVFQDVILYLAEVLNGKEYPEYAIPNRLVPAP